MTHELLMSRSGGPQGCQSVTGRIRHGELVDLKPGRRFVAAASRNERNFFHHKRLTMDH
jgi:hypothetical protein